MVLPQQMMKTKLGGSGKANIVSDLVGLTFKEIGEHTVTISTDGGASRSCVLAITRLTVAKEKQSHAAVN